ncbi:MAG: chromosome segregation protein SMC [Spirochaetaceae bacterium]|nr:MAG: chromosome segregation protein SMC [Spirochaetaceae bacterium]
MYISRIRLQNWMNFTAVDVRLGKRAFVVGPNASGKSNFLDAIRFLRDLARGDGFSGAVEKRGGVTRIRCLAARRVTDVKITVDLTESEDADPEWSYTLAFAKEPAGAHSPVITEEIVERRGRVVLRRPDEEDGIDPLRLSQTHLEQISSNKEFRPVAEFLRETRYVHFVPQLIRKPEVFFGGRVTSDEEAFGFRFLEHLSDATEQTRKARLGKIEQALRLAVPQLSNLRLTPDTMGVPHLEALYDHWRPKAGKQRESQFSDGTIRLIGLLWSILDSHSVLLLEEPELSLHPALVRELAPLIYRVSRQSKRKPQVITTTHSPDLLDNSGIAASEILLLTPGAEGTSVKPAADIPEIRVLLESGLSPAEVVIPATAPPGASQLALFKPD